MNPGAYGWFYPIYAIQLRVIQFIGFIEFIGFIVFIGFIEFTQI